MKFRLIQKSQNRVQTKFHVTNDGGDVVGSINVENQEVPDLLRCWSGSTADSVAPPKGSTNLMVAAMLKTRRPISQAAILRGCL